MAHPVDVLRRFNRNYTRRIGVLEDRFLGLDRPLAASRVLWEIGVDGRPVTELRNTLGVDSAYLSRLLRRLEADDLVATEPDPADRRRRRAVLTDQGRQEWHELDKRSQDRAESLIAPLGPAQQERLSEALATAERLIAAAAVTITAADPLDASAVESLRRYFAELDQRFETGFDAGSTITADASSYRPPNGVFLLGRHEQVPIACGAVHRIDPETAEIKRMWVDSEWRGVGIGGRMLDHLEKEARSLDCLVVRLDTNSVLTEAIAMYRNAGYRPIDRYNDNPFAKHWFEKKL